MTDPNYLPDNRAAARAQGYRFYWGLECQAHPEAARYTVNARCVECAKAERRMAAPAMRERDAARKRMARQSAKASPAATASDFADLLG